MSHESPKSSRSTPKSKLFSSIRPSGAATSRRCRPSAPIDHHLAAQAARLLALPKNVFMASPLEEHTSSTASLSRLSCSPSRRLWTSRSTSTSARASASRHTVSRSSLCETPCGFPLPGFALADTLDECSSRVDHDLAHTAPRRPTAPAMADNGRRRGSQPRSNGRTDAPGYASIVAARRRHASAASPTPSAGTSSASDDAGDDDESSDDAGSPGPSSSLASPCTSSRLVE